jgi:phosphoglycerate dehydrogenase-like enzyme
MRGIFNDHISAHIMSYVLDFSRGLHVYLANQREKEWEIGYPIA